MRNRWLYPDNWEELAWACKERAGWRCEHCGIEHLAQAVNERTGVISIVYLVAAHLDHDPWNPYPRLAALCPSCHGRYDYSWCERQRWLALEDVRHRLWVQAHVSEME
jgi:hypothetical protein